MWWKKPLMAYGILGLIGLALNWSVNDYIQITILYILVNMILGMSLNLVNGFTGQFSLGHAGFMAVGAYFSAYASMHWSFLSGPNQIFELILFTLGAGTLAAGFGYIVGLPSLRLKGDYLAIVTLGFGEIIRVGLLNIPAFGARPISGIASFPEIKIGGMIIDRFVSSYFVCLAWVILCFIVLWRLKFSQYGKAFFSIREDEMAAESMGIPTTAVKIKAFVLSSFFAGVAGALYAHLTNVITPNSFTFSEKSVNAVIMVVLGGMGSITGSCLAAIFLTVMPELLRSVQDVIGIDIRMILFSLCLILVMIFRPQGMMGEKEVSLNFFYKKKKAKNA